MQLSHNELEHQVYQYLVLRGWLVIHTHDSRHHPCEPGVPDLIALRMGTALLLEVKAGKDRMSSDQVNFRDRAISRGITVHEVRSLDEVTEMVRRQ